MQRDLYSAFLARNSEGNMHQPPVLENAWHALESFLQQAGWCVIKPQTAGLARLQSDFMGCQSGSPAIPVEVQRQRALLPV